VSETNGKTAIAETVEETTQTFERVVVLTFDGDRVTCQVEGGSVFEAPSLLRRGAKQIEAQLTGDA
jgi:hypothetical protein